MDRCVGNKLDDDDDDDDIILPVLFVSGNH